MGVIVSGNLKYSINSKRISQLRDEIFKILQNFVNKPNTEDTRENIKGSIRDLFSYLHSIGFIRYSASELVFIIEIPKGNLGKIEILTPEYKDILEILLKEGWTE